MDRHSRAEEPPRFLVGVMHCIENEFEECMEAIHAQEGVELEVFVISNKPNKEAHDELYQTFMKRAADFDYFVKVDADMVLCRRDFLQSAHVKFSENPDIMVLTVGVEDYFLSEIIDGLHIFRSSFKWEERQSDLFTDHHQIQKGERLVDMDDLAPAATHCFHASGFQSFHYGVHRGVKLRSALEGDLNFKIKAVSHGYNVRKIRTRSKTVDELNVALAGLGVELGIAGDFDASDIPYTRDRISKFYHERLKSMSLSSIRKLSHVKRRKNFMHVPKVTLYLMHQEFLEGSLSRVYAPVVKKVFPYWLHHSSISHKA